RRPPPSLRSQCLLFRLCRNQPPSGPAHRQERRRPRPRFAASPSGGRSGMTTIRGVAARQLKVGVFVPQGWRMDLAEVRDPVEKYETMSRCALEAESAGFDAVWVYDHFHTVPEPRLESVFECWTSMAGLARDT